MFSRIVRSRMGPLERYGDAGEPDRQPFGLARRDAVQHVCVDGVDALLCRAQRAGAFAGQVCLEHPAVCGGWWPADKPAALEPGHDPDHRLGRHEGQPRRAMIQRPTTCRTIA
jgi:hypothetical protein